MAFWDVEEADTCFCGTWFYAWSCKLMTKNGRGLLKTFERNQTFVQISSLLDLTRLGNNKDAFIVHVIYTALTTRLDNMHAS